MKSKYLWALTVSFISFLVYFRTLNPIIEWEDSVEFSIAAHTLGIMHPTGYPLHTMLGKVFTLIPMGSIGFRVNLMSAFFAALTLFVLYLLLHDFLKDKLVVSILTLTFAFTPIFWSQAVIAEVHTLSLFLFTLSLYFLFKINENHNYIYFFSFTYGLALTNHLTLILFAPAFVYYLYNKTNLKDSMKSFALFLVGLLPYLYIPIRSLANPILDWGNPETITAFFRHITGAQYQSRMLDFGIGDSLLYFLKSVFLQYYYLAIFIILGIYLIYKKKEIIFFVLLIVINLIYNLTYDIGTGIKGVGVFYLPLLLVFLLPIGEVLKKIPRKWAIIVLLPILLLSLSNFAAVDQSDNYYSYLYGKDVANTIDGKAILFTDWDVTLPVFWYLKYVDNDFSDIEIIHLNAIGLPWYDQTLIDTYQTNNITKIMLTQDNLYATNDDFLLPAGYNYYKQGLLFKISTTEVFNKDFDYLLSKEFMENSERNEITEVISIKYANHYINLGLDRAAAVENAAAMEYFQIALIINPNSKEAKDNIAILKNEK